MISIRGDSSYSHDTRAVIYCNDNRIHILAVEVVIRENDGFYDIGESPELYGIDVKDDDIDLLTLIAKDGVRLNEMAGKFDYDVILASL